MKGRLNGGRLGHRHHTEQLPFKFVKGGLERLCGIRIGTQGLMQMGLGALQQLLNGVLHFASVVLSMETQKGHFLIFLDEKDYFFSFVSDRWIHNVLVAHWFPGNWYRGLLADGDMGAIDRRYRQSIEEGELIDGETGLAHFGDKAVLIGGGGIHGVFVKSLRKKMNGKGSFFYGDSRIFTSNKFEWR